MYLGYWINKDGIFPLPEKIDFIKNAKSPKNVTKLKSYLGLINYCHCHSPNFSIILEPLHKLLINYDPEKPMVIARDFLPSGLGAVLSQIMPDKSERPITFTLWTLTNTEINYSQIEKEELVIIFAVKTFHQYIYGQTATTQTDHKPLLGLLAECKYIPSME